MILTERVQEYFPTIRRVVLLSALATGFYVIGRCQGVEEGKKQGKDEIVMSLALNQYDILERAKFPYIQSLEEQNEMLERAGSIGRVFRILKSKGYMDQVSSHVRAAAGYKEK